jgi:prephenate dehydratase
MEAYPAPARPIVARMSDAAAQHPERAVSFQGAPGANSHIAALEAVPDCCPLPCFAFDDAIEAGQDGTADRAIIPIENSQHGRVADIHFLLPESGLVIVGEHFLPIRYALMGIGPVARIKEAMSHPQALGQCRNWLKARDIQPVSYPDTAGAAARVAELADPRIAALAPPGAAAIYGLETIAADIADADHNTTRFVILAREPLPLTGDGPFITTLIFAVKNVPAALYKAMGGFATNGVNMTKLESYMLDGSFTATQFYADIEGHPADRSVQLAFEELQFFTDHFHVLGVYPSGKNPN